MKRYLKLILCLLIPISIGGISGIATASGLGSWFIGLQKPFFNPPGFLFGPVWTALYLLMGISFFRVIQEKSGPDKKAALLIFSVQLVLNFFWSFLFFKFHLLGFALIEIVLLWFCILLMIKRFRKLNRLTAYLQIPYLLWVSFASVLNASIWWLNK